MFSEAFLLTLASYKVISESVGTVSGLGQCGHWYLGFHLDYRMLSVLSSIIVVSFSGWLPPSHNNLLTVYRRLYHSWEHLAELW